MPEQEPDPAPIRSVVTAIPVEASQALARQQREELLVKIHTAVASGDLEHVKQVLNESIASHLESYGPDIGGRTSSAFGRLGSEVAPVDQSR